MSGPTDAERLARIEAVLERIEPMVASIRGDLDADKADLAALKYKGAGMLIGIGITAAVLGAKAQAVLGAIVGAFR